MMSSRKATLLSLLPRPALHSEFCCSQQVSRAKKKLNKNVPEREEKTELGDMLPGTQRVVSHQRNARLAYTQTEFTHTHINRD